MLLASKIAVHIVKCLTTERVEVADRDRQSGRDWREGLCPVEYFLVGIARRTNVIALRLQQDLLVL